MASIFQTLYVQRRDYEEIFEEERMRGENERREEDDKRRREEGEKMKTMDKGRGEEEQIKIKKIGEEKRC